MEQINIVPKESYKDFLTKENPSGVDLLQLEQNQKTVPSQAELSKNFAIDRTTTYGKGYYQTAIAAERKALLNGIITYAADVKSKVGNANYSTDWIKFIPNTRLAYVNRLTKQALSNGISQCDYLMLEKIYMNPTSKTEMLSFFKELVDNRLSGFSVPPTQSRSGVRFDCDTTNNKLIIPLKNPGNVEIESSHSFPITSGHSTCYPGGKCCSDCISEYKSVQPWRTMQKDTPQITDSDFLMYFRNYLEENKPNSDYQSHMGQPDYLKFLSNLYSMLDSEKWNLEDIDVVINKIRDSWETQKYNYISNILNPWVNRHSNNAKIPSLIPFPTASVCVTSSIIVKTNTSGNAAFAWNPYLVSTTTNNTSLFTVNNDNSLTGSASSLFFLARATELQCPLTTAYAQYRLVSAAAKLKYRGSDLNNNGRLMIALDPQSAGQAPVTPATLPANYAKYGDFSQILNGYFLQTAGCKQGAEVECIWMSPDNSSQNFQFINSAFSSTVIIGCIQGAASEANCLEIEYVANYELMVENESSDWIPRSIYRGSFAEKDTAQMIIGAAIQNDTSLEKVREQNHSIGTKPSGFVDKLIDPKHNKLIKQKDQNMFTRFLNWAAETIGPAYAVAKSVETAKDVATPALDALLGLLRNIKI